MPKYKVVRMFFRGGNRTIKKDLSLQEAQEHCKNIEASSKTAVSKAGVSRTKKSGPWFDGYEEMK